jgi:hypothetical protein
MRSPDEYEIAAAMSNALVRQRPWVRFHLGLHAGYALWGRGEDLLLIIQAMIIGGPKVPKMLPEIDGATP